MTTTQGKTAAKNFRRKTIEDMNKNINLLKYKGLLADEFYHDSTPVGIFVIVNKSEEELLKYKIGSVGLPYFTRTSKDYAQKYSRICIAVPHKYLKEYFDML